MYPSNSGTQRWFGPQSVGSFKVSRNYACLDLVGSQPPPPTVPPPTPGDFTVNIRVNHDNYPEETSWSLKDSNGATLASQSINTITMDGTVVSRDVGVDVGEYTFSISDSYGDGVCCSWGIGSFSVSVGGTNQLGLLIVLIVHVALPIGMLVSIGEASTW